MACCQIARLPDCQTVDEQAFHQIRKVRTMNEELQLPSVQRHSPVARVREEGLAQYAINVGLRCGHDCTYCSSRAMLRCHPAFKELGRRAFATGYSIVDPDIADKVAADAKRLRRRGLVQLCTTVDAWAPEAQQLDLGRRCLEAVLAEPGWTVRILTKNAAVADDFDLIKKHRDRVLVGLSLTGTPDKEAVMSVVEPHASPISERMAALKQGSQAGPADLRDALPPAARHR